MKAKEFINQYPENKQHDWLFKNKDVVAKLMEGYANLSVIIELELIKKDIKALNKINSPLCCDDIDMQLEKLRVTQLKNLKR